MGICCSINLIKDAIVLSKYGTKVYDDYIGYDNFVRFQKQTLDKENETSQYVCVPVVLHIDSKVSPINIIQDILPERAYTIECICYGNYRIYKVHLLYNSY
jgi:hypothetical protein